MAFKKIVVAGSSGNLADHVLKALLDCTTPKFDVTVLTRSNSGKKVSVPGARVVPVNYGDKADLAAAVSGADAIMNLVSGKVGGVVDKQLLEAAKETGVRRIFPCWCGMDVLHPSAVALFTRPDGSPLAPVVSPVQDARKFLALAEENSTVSFTTLIPSLFIDAALEGRFGTIEPQNRKITLFDDGKHHVTGSSLPFIGACFVAVLQMDEEKTKNKRIRVAEVRTSLKEIAETFEKVTKLEFEKVPVSIESMLAKRQKALEEGQIIPAFYTSLMTAVFNGSGAGDIEDGLQFDGDGFLTLKRKSIEELVTEAVAKVDIA
ncbi:LADA_0D06436g1_1 [Lachancea dasiensis]|uniref:LADA_0D06436g1_1 n=1 Tax=Lachancea dasiensis TaxID=1072105 RepID=A0A1G4J6P1_9SACH|nr:LADA_0D06436g1_1 [Lachancea dasiensis]